MSIQNKIKLNAFNKDDLKIFSFLCQDAIVSEDEFVFDKTKKLFVATLARYCWEKKDYNNQVINYRVISGLQIKNVNDIEYVNLYLKCLFIIYYQLHTIGVILYYNFLCPQK